MQYDIRTLLICLFPCIFWLLYRLFSFIQFYVGLVFVYFFVLHIVHCVAFWRNKRLIEWMAA